MKKYLMINFCILATMTFSLKLNAQDVISYKIDKYKNIAIKKLLEEVKEKVDNNEISLNALFQAINTNTIEDQGWNLPTTCMRKNFDTEPTTWEPMINKETNEIIKLKLKTTEYLFAGYMSKQQLCAHQNNDLIDTDFTNSNPALHNILLDFIKHGSTKGFEYEWCGDDKTDLKKTFIQRLDTQHNGESIYIGIGYCMEKYIDSN